MKLFRLAPLALLVLASLPAWGEREFPVDKPQPLHQMRFSEPKRESQWKRFRALAMVRMKGASHKAPHRNGNFIEEYWVSGPTSFTCNTSITANFRQTPGAAWYRWQLVHYALPEVFGLGFEAGRNPLVDGWGVSLESRFGGRNLISDLCQVRLCKLFSGRVIDEIRPLDADFKLPAQVRWEGHETISCGIPPSPQRLARLLASDQEFLAVSRETLDSLERRIREAVRTHKIQRLVSGRYEGNGIPPIQHPVPLDPQEEAALLTRWTASLERWRGVLRQHHKTFRKSLVDLLPSEQRKADS